VGRLVPRGGRFVMPTESVRVVNATPDDVMRCHDAWVNAGYEGAMYKADEPYRFKRSSALLKIKKFDTIDATIVGFEEGAGKYEGRLGALVIQLDDGTNVNVGSGYTDAQRSDFWDRQAKFKGKTAEVQYQNKTTKGSLRFPVFRQIRDDK